jgi:ketosteroid isomerase-like protein
MAAYAAAILAKDVDAFMQLYDADVHVFDLWGRAAYVGWTQWRANVSEWFASLGDESVRVAFSDVRSTDGQGLTACHALVTYTGISAEGTERRAMVNRLTWVLRDFGGQWKIVHEHTSAPADVETGRVVLKP